MFVRTSQIKVGKKAPHREFLIHIKSLRVDSVGISQFLSILHFCVIEIKKNFSLTRISVMLMLGLELMILSLRRSLPLSYAIVYYFELIMKKKYHIKIQISNTQAC
jgi:ABC-type transporter Mla maintaining outer membrane lipid asymmetry permease subunit MlaE